MIKSFHDGIITVDALPGTAAEEHYRSLLNANWRQARVAQKYDGFRIKEIVDTENRDAFSVHPDFVVDQTNALIETVFPLAVSAIKSCWDIAIQDWSSPQFTLYKQGHFIKAHRDSGDAFPKRLFTVVLYLTADYLGGAIKFPRANLELHPLAGQALIFPSDLVHEVRPIQSGQKCVFLFFLDTR